MTSKRSHSRLAMLALATLLGLGGLSLNLTPAHAADGPSIFRFSTQRHACTRSKNFWRQLCRVSTSLFSAGSRIFQNNIKKTPPDAVLTMRAVIDQQKGVSAILQGPQAERLRSPTC